MKRILLTLATGMLAASTLRAQVYINELLANPPGSDSTVSLGLEYFELRGTPNLSLAGYYLISIEGQGTTGRGDINQFFDLGAYSLGANGFLFAQQFGSPYTPVNGSATLLANTPNQGWGQVNGTGSSVGHSSDGTQVDLENSAATIWLINRGAGAAPTLTQDLDSDNNGVAELPSGWTVVDSIALSDGTGTPAATDFSYGAITFRFGALGSDNAGNLITIPGTGGNLYVGRKGDSTGSTSADWMGAFLTGTAGNFSFSATDTSDLTFGGLPITIMQFGATNAPEPSSALLLGAGCLLFGLARRRR